MNILQNLFQHSKAPPHQITNNLLLLPKINNYRTEENSSSLFEGAGDRFNQTPRKPRLNLTPKQYRVSDVP